MNNEKNNSYVDILLATYNGEHYIEEQLESIINQTYSNWKLYIRDDNSSDNTVNIIKGYIEKFPEKIYLVEDIKKGLGAKKNFFELIKYSKNDYCMFCDQDDVWLNNKIELTMREMKKIEGEKTKKIPILVHTDLKVVSEELELINESFIKYQNLDPEMKALNNLLLQNNITGCTVMINLSLKQECKNIPENCIMHDWWLGLIASAFGEISFINEQTILYRQHSMNEVGAKNYNSYKFILGKINSTSQSIENGIKQGIEFFNMYKSSLSDKDLKIVKVFISLKSKNIIDRKLCIFSNKFYQSGLIRNIGYILFI